MAIARNRILVFEHDTIRLNQEFKTDGNIVKFGSGHLEAVQKFYGNNGVPYFSLTHNGIKFNEFVGVLQVGNLVIEVLPKADKYDTDTTKWKRLLIDMLRKVGVFDIHSPSNSPLTLKNNSILDIYFELFVKEVEFLIHAGLIKKYRKTEGNVTALKGSLQFSKHIQQNLTHQERFYTRYTTYDVTHQIHIILYKALLLLKQINTNASLQSRIGSLLLDFPEMPSLHLNEAIFERIVFNRKSDKYRKSIEIARLLLLNYHPDLSKGRNNILALMLDMNLLWEKFIVVSLRKYKTDIKYIHAQSSKPFWQAEEGSRSIIKPDIFIELISGEKMVLDTKWKNIYGKNPSPEDLRQMYAYSLYYDANTVNLVYPGVEKSRKGCFLHKDNGAKSELTCGVINIKPMSNIADWMQEIANEIR
jgi:5-methylcytosine-specific restriction enzyme subunit McrC